MAEMIAPVLGKYPFFVWEQDMKYSVIVLATPYAIRRFIRRHGKLPLPAQYFAGRGIGTSLLGNRQSAARQGGAPTLISNVAGGNTACESYASKGGNKGGWYRCVMRGVNSTNISMISTTASAAEEGKRDYEWPANCQTHQ